MCIGLAFGYAWYEISCKSLICGKNLMRLKDMRSIKHRDNALSYLHFLLKGESEMESRRRFKAFALNNKRKRKKAIVPGGRVHARSTGRSSQSRAAVPAATVRSGLGT